MDETKKESKSVFSYICNYMPTKVLNVKSLNSIANQGLLIRVNEENIQSEIRRRKWEWLGHTFMKNPEAIEKKVLDCNPQDSRRPARHRIMWRRTVQSKVDEGKRA